MKSPVLACAAAMLRSVLAYIGTPRCSVLAFAATMQCPVRAVTVQPPVLAYAATACPVRA
eukprot:3940847-Rhodomonas_salina.3